MELKFQRSSANANRKTEVLLESQHPNTSSNYNWTYFTITVSITTTTTTPALLTKILLRTLKGFPMWAKHLTYILEYGLFPMWAKLVMGAFHFMNKLSQYFIHNSFFKYLQNLKSVTNSAVKILNCKSVIATVSTILPQNQEPSVCWFFHQFHNSAGYQVNQQRSYLTV